MIDTAFVCTKKRVRKIPLRIRKLSKTEKLPRNNKRGLKIRVNRGVLRYRRDWNNSVYREAVVRWMDGSMTMGKYPSPMTRQ